MVSEIKIFLARIFGKERSMPVQPAAAVPAVTPPDGPLNATAELAVTEKPREKEWIGVDLDGTLAFYDGWRGFDHIGKPVPGIKARVLDWIARGYRVKIFTARATVPEGVVAIKSWLAANGFPELEITATKDFGMIELWDDRVVQVVTNSGSPVLSARWGALPRAPLFGLEKKVAGTPETPNAANQEPTAVSPPSNTSDTLP